MDSGHIFLSYSTTDRAFADDLARRLEAKGVRVWMAPRDVRPGSDYSEALQDAIETSTAVVALVSDDSNRSRHVRAEIEIAFSRGKPLFPVRFHDIVPARGLALFLGLRHWTDLFGADEAGNLDRLAAELTLRPAAPGATPAPPRPPPTRRPPPASAPRASTGNKLMIAAICLSLAVILGVAVLAILRNAGSAEEPLNGSTNGLAYGPGRDRPSPAPVPVQNRAEPIAPPPYVAPDPPAPVGTGGDWIVGSWILAGESCSGRDGATYGSDRNWATAGGGGTWSIDGTTLTNVTYYQIRQGNRVQRDTPLTTHYQARSISPQQIDLLRSRDQVELRLYRCP